mmetsp:Transcript_48379/g.94534  ORF Transcript_48379/g.94534 Transcript_48379/m.94534 type:complete len:239 (-) Transcript_48379:297-1013(-)|eukprot:CAMPEP_0194350694 /NCGR_PEP_ID=MMETSP0171-20130528/107776_1 /TAXON_ID=218684 /ORGANISM="Corethron pennatum, Strain L29A3" /LENGTH=238 /DNA_ID=CAMNT_0039118263 /DNA_START=432 /DNA_END=1148 /DNA_ORIENTATION=-
MTWDSYSAPCLDVRVEDVAIRVEFTDLLLTRTNFDRLREFGFPPASLLGGGVGATSSDVRIGSLGLEGTVTLTLESAALRGKGSAAGNQRLAEDVVLNLSVLRVLEDKIREASERNGRRGVSTEELAEIIGRLFRDEVTKIISSSLVDLARGEGSKGVAKGIITVKRTTDAFLDYFGAAVETIKERDIEVPLSEMLHRWGLNEEQANWARGIAASAAASTMAEATNKIQKMVWGKGKD